MSDTSIGERLKLFRKHENLKQKDIAAGVQVKETTVTAWECAYRPIPDRMIQGICREFGVNENWLRTGEGEMIIPKSRSQQISDFIADVEADDDSFKARLINALANLDQDEWDVLERIADEIKKKK